MRRSELTCSACGDCPKPSSTQFPGITGRKQEAFPGADWTCWPLLILPMHWHGRSPRRVTMSMAWPPGIGIIWRLWAWRTGLTSGGSWRAESPSRKDSRMPNPSTPSKRILFVDDEPCLLQGLQRMLHSQRRQWDLSFAKSGAEALALIETASFDVVVTDMRMPGMDGAALLERVRELRPGIIRIVLSGFFDMEAAVRAVPVAHQFLAKPCDPEKLRAAIDRACGCNDMLPDENTRRIVGAIGKLPALPRTCAALMRALEEPEVSLEEVGRIIEQDVGITAKVLQLVNSAFFGLLREITTVRMAVNYLGLETLKHLVLTAEIFRTFHPERNIPGFSLEEFQEHSRLAGQIAARLPASKAVSSSAVIAAVLHDAGKLVLASRLPQEFALMLRVSAKDRRPLHTVEPQIIGTGHAEIGGYLLGLWALPPPIVDAVCRHHRPEAGEGGLDVLAITHLADALAYEAAAISGNDHPGCSLFDEEYVSRLGVADQLPEWRELAAQLAKAPANL
ncbi:MAG: two-component system response regulator [Terriglobia bacterium]|nr:MAG: two-component system response regulator [Terriglobia bacterium]